MATDTAQTTTQTDDKAPAPRSGEELAQIRTEQSRLDHETASEVLSAHNDADDSTPEPRPLKSNPPLEDATDVLSDYWQRTKDAQGKGKNKTDTGGNNQSGPSYQPATATLQDPEHMDDRTKRIDPAQVQPTTGSDSDTTESQPTTDENDENAPQAQGQTQAQG